ncbi:MAG: alpha-E domain-containing protein [Pseudomonadota bacterium]
MLSRVAERIYWMARYIERAENSARLVNAYTHQVLDLPKGVEPGWRQLIDITGSGEDFAEHYPGYGEQHTIDFVVANAANPSSILASIGMARENMRTTRELLPGEAWQHCNELYLYARNHARDALPRRGRYAFLKEVIFRCQQLTGLLASTMSHDAAYDFVRIGRNLERADMTTRIVDSAIFLLMPRQQAPGQYDNLLWVNVLKSLSAYQMYRQHVRNRVEGAAVVKFLLQDNFFPRTVSHAAAVAESGLRNLPRHEAPLRRVSALQERLRTAEIAAMDLAAMHAFIDELQLAINEVQEAIGATWFQAQWVERRYTAQAMATA